MVTGIDSTEHPGDDEQFDNDHEGDDVPPRSKKSWLIAGAVVIVATFVGVGLWLSVGSSPIAYSPEGVALQNVPDLASPNTTATGAPVDGITCRMTQQQKVVWHIHILVDIYVRGRPVRIPAGAGIPAPRSVQHLADGLYVLNNFDNCLYWLHVHTNDGILHVESPYNQLHTFTLGQFFDIWQQPLSPTQVGPAKGTVVAFENGKRYTGDPHDIPLLPHGVIQLDVGTPVVAFQPRQFEVNGLCSVTSGGCGATDSPATH